MRIPCRRDDYPVGNETLRKPHLQRWCAWLYARAPAPNRVRMEKEFGRADGDDAREQELRDDADEPAGHGRPEGAPLADPESDRAWWLLGSGG
ncbi:hypothetical protein GCM10017779_63840 [Streptomyces capillispiralis]|nr:hypothetical protein GCM10017779_63840 [Streptomyces capillispiralis]